MTNILLRVTGAQAWATVTGPLTSGMVGIPITIEYDAAWDGLTKNLVCRCSEWGTNSAEQRTILNVGETAVVAHEVMKAGMYLYLGIEGRSADGTLVIPTTWARCGEIQYGANAGTEVSTDPTLPVWEQLQTQLGQLQQDVVTKEQMVGIMDSVQSATQAAAISAGRAEAAAKRAEEAAADHDSQITPHIGANGNWFVGDTDTGVKAAGEDGYTPVKGVDYFTEAEVQEIAELAAEMVDVPSGGGNPWRCIANLELSEEVNLLEFTEDVDGNSFNVNEIVYGLYVLPNAAGTTGSRISLTGVMPIADGVPATGYRVMEARAVYACGVAFTDYLRLGTNYANKLDPTEAYSTLAALLREKVTLTDQTGVQKISVNFVVNAGVGTKIIIFAR